MGINSLRKVNLTTAFIQLLKREKFNYIKHLNTFLDQNAGMKVGECNSLTQK
jgi:hypothetical protein